MHDHLGQPIQRPGQFALPHHLTFSSLVTGGIRSYLHDRWDEALRDSRDNAAAMWRDGWFKSLLKERIRGTSSLNWHLEPDEPRDKTQAGAAAIVTKAVKQTPRLRRFNRQLLWAIWFGRYANQVGWKWQGIDNTRCLTVDQHLPVDGDKLGWTHQQGSIDPIPYVLVHSAYEDKLGKAEIETTTFGRGLLLKGGWRQRFIIHTSEPSDMDFFAGEQSAAIFGAGLRHQSYFLWFLRDEYLSWAIDTLERTGLGLVTIEYESGNPDAERAAEKVMKDYSRRNIIKVPVQPGSRGSAATKAGGLSIVETPTAGLEVLDKMRQRVEDQIERLFVGQSMSSGKDDEDGLGGTGRAKFAENTKRAILAEDADELAETLTGSDREPGLVSMIFRWSLPQLYGKFNLRWVFDLEETDPDKKLEAVNKAFQIGASFKEDEVRELTGMSKPEPQDQVLSFAQQQQQQAQQQQQGQMAQGQQQHQQTMEQGEQQHRQGLEQGQQEHQQKLAHLTAEQQHAQQLAQAKIQHEQQQAAAGRQHEQSMKPPAPAPLPAAPPAEPVAGWIPAGLGPRGGRHWKKGGREYTGKVPPGASPDSKAFLEYLQQQTGGNGEGAAQYAKDAAGHEHKEEEPVT